MSERVLRRPLSQKSTSSSVSTSSNSSQKRKSADEGDCEDAENLSPNLSTKKPRPKVMDTVTDKADKVVDENAICDTADQKVKSGLPRYNRLQPRLGTGTTPAKSKLRMPGTPLSLTATKRIGRRSSFTSRSLIRIGSYSDKIGSYFDDAFTVNESKIIQIMSVLKVKGKKAPFVDFKEKAKRYETVIKELREALRTVLTEIPSLREKSVSHEAFITGMIAEMDADLQVNHGEKEALRVKQTLLHEELEIVSLELKSASSVAESLKKEHSPLRNRSQEVEALYKEIQGKYAEEVALRQHGEAEVELLTSEIRSVNDLQESTLQQHEKEMADVTSAHTEEVSGLRAELGRRVEEVTRGAAEMLEANIRAAGMKEELNSSGANLRESENLVRRYESDTIRMTADIERSAKQLEQKEADLRATMASLTEERAAIRADMGALQSRITQLEGERVETACLLAGKREECLSISRELAHQKDTMVALQSKEASRDAEILAGQEAITELEVARKLLSILEVREEAERRERVACSAQLLATQTQCASQISELQERMAANTHALQSEIKEMTAMRDAGLEDIRTQQDVVMRLNSEVLQLRHALEDASVSSAAIEELAKLTGECEVLKRRMREASERKEFEGSATADRILELTEQMRLGEVQRRKLHNLVQELRGNVRVFARVRPFLPSDGMDLSAQPTPPASIAVKSDDVSLRISKAGGGGATSAVGVDRPEDHSFTFDRTFGPSSSQETVFTEVSEFVQSALDGYNVCLFSYGQTGSGKTHTMAGSGSGSMRGIIPRAIQQVGAYKTELEGKGWEYQMEVSFIEIYNETIRDLLRGVSAEEGKHEIKRDPAGNMFVSDVTMAPVDPNDGQQMDAIMELAARHRSVEKTAMNERSSRSHSVFTLHLHASNASQKILLKGTLSLVDLAGSERLDRSGAAGARMKETVAINKSLSSLVDVFAAIGSKQSHIPFRNSKLTYLLSPALSGDGKTLMMVNLSPTEESYFESLCSLRFAAQVNQCELGKPKKQQKEGVAPALTPALTPADTPNTSEKSAVSITRIPPTSGPRKPKVIAN